MNRMLRGIGAALCLIAALFSARPRFGIDGEDLGLLFFLLFFSGVMLMIWFAPNPHRAPGRIGAWGMSLFFPLWAWLGFQRIPHKAIVIFLALALLVVSEWRYAHPSAEQRMAGSLEGTVKTTARNLLIWLATTTSLVLLWQLIRRIL